MSIPFRHKLSFLHRFWALSVGVKDGRYYEVCCTDKVYTKRSKVGHLQVSKVYEALLWPLTDSVPNI